MRDLDRRHPDAAGAGVDQNAFARAQPRHVLQRVPRGHEDDRQRGRRFKSEIAGNAPHVACPRDGVRGNPENGQTKNAIARRNMGDIRRQSP